tara:strand:+ start:669 stop:899 length:231 start_codon:yes stop_codon:yes gene_type:complete
MKGVPHYTKSGKLFTGKTHKMKDGTLHSGASHTTRSVKLFHKNELPKSVQQKLKGVNVNTKKKPHKKKTKTTKKKY